MSFQLINPDLLDTILIQQYIIIVLDIKLNENYIPSYLYELISNEFTDYTEPRSTNDYS